MKAGFVSIIGRPNVGKSTLLNSILDQKIAITSNKAGTTRHIIQGIYNDSDSQIIFVDTPGIGKQIDKLGSELNRKAYFMTNDIDVILFMIDAESGFGKGDRFILKRLEENKTPVFLLLNKVDKMVKEKLLNIIDDMKDLYPFEEIIPISAYKKDNIDVLIDCIKKHLHEEEQPYFDQQEVTNVSTKFILAEIVREKILRLTREEVPHSVTCYVEEYEEDDDIVHLGVLIIVDRENLKKIIIGKQGKMLKDVGTKAREDMEAFLGKKVFLSTHVKVIEDWRNKEKYLIELGLKEELE